MKMNKKERGLYVQWLSMKTPGLNSWVYILSLLFISLSPSFLVNKIGLI